MSKIILFSILAAIILLIIACLFLRPWSPNPTPTTASGQNIINGTPTPLLLAVTPNPNTYSAVDQTITYSYLVTNTGTLALAGPVAVTDDRVSGVACPNLDTIGNRNNNLDGGESVTCTGGLKTTQADISNQQLTNKSTATVGGMTSNQVTTTILAGLNKVLTIAVSANPTSFSAANQTITYTYVITNVGATPVGPTQFVVKDDRIPNLINCGANTTTLATNQTVTCTAVYVTTDADVSATKIINTATATTPTGAATIQPASVTVLGGGTPPPPITPGTSITHIAQTGEWMLQIGRCFGANFNALVKSNPKITNPNFIRQGENIIVPNVGSDGTIWGPPCVVYYKVVSGDTWQSVANRYNADAVIMKEANPGVTFAPGVTIKVPVNSNKSGVPYNTPQPTPIPPTLQPTVRQPIRLIFPGTNPASVSQTGNIGTPDTIRYIFSAAAGQILSVQLTVPSNDVALGLYGPNNAALKQPDLINSWSGTLTLNGDYAIDLVSSVGSPNKTYTLTVTLTTPTPIPVTNAEMVVDIYPGSGSSNVSYLSPYTAQLYFQANGNDGAGAELWRYDRGLNAASRVADIYPGPTGSEPAYLRPYKDNLLYFSANGNDGAGIELWRTNGSAPATGRVNDLFPGPEGSRPSYMTEFNGLLYFSANGNNGAGVELWRFDGTSSALAADINPGPGNSNPSYLAVFNNALYFAATTTNGGTELWKFDGNTATLAADITPGIGNGNPAFLAVFNNLLYFSANGNNGAGTELWKFDGINASMAADINPGPNDSAPTYMTVFNNALFFGANGNNAGFELWKFDGTNASMAADINPAGSSNPAYLAVYSSELYFQATGNNAAGAELWRYKGQ